MSNPIGRSGVGSANVDSLLARLGHEEWSLLTAAFWSSDQNASMKVNVGIFASGVSLPLSSDRAAKEEGGPRTNSLESRHPLSAHGVLGGETEIPKFETLIRAYDTLPKAPLVFSLESHNARGSTGDHSARTNPEYALPGRPDDEHRSSSPNWQIISPTAQQLPAAPHSFTHSDITVAVSRRPDELQISPAQSLSQELGERIVPPVHDAGTAVSHPAVSQILTPAVEHAGYVPPTFAPSPEAAVSAESLAALRAKSTPIDNLNQGGPPPSPPPVGRGVGSGPSGDGTPQPPTPFPPMPALPGAPDNPPAEGGPSLSSHPSMPVQPSDAGDPLPATHQGSPTGNPSPPPMASATSSLPPAQPAGIHQTQIFDQSGGVALSGPWKSTEPVGPLSTAAAAGPPSAALSSVNEVGGSQWGERPGFPGSNLLPSQHPGETVRVHVLPTDNSNHHEPYPAGAGVEHTLVGGGGLQLPEPNPQSWALVDASRVPHIFSDPASSPPPPVLVPPTASGELLHATQQNPHASSNALPLVNTQGAVLSPQPQELAEAPAIDQSGGAQYGRSLSPAGIHETTSGQEASRYHDGVSNADGSGVGAEHVSTRSLHTSNAVSLGHALDAAPDLLTEISRVVHSQSPTTAANEQPRELSGHAVLPSLDATRPTLSYPTLGNTAHANTTRLGNVTAHLGSVDEPFPSAKPIPDELRFKLIAYLSTAETSPEHLQYPLTESTNTDHQVSGFELTSSLSAGELHHSSSDPGIITPPSGDLLRISLDHHGTSTDNLHQHDLDAAPHHDAFWGQHGL